MTASSSALNNRAEKIRQRRTDQTQQRIERVTVYSRSATRTNPPVTFRSNNIGQPVIQRTAKRQPRRIFFLNMGTNVELATPALPMIRPGWRILSGMLVIALVAMLLFALGSDTFKINTAQLKGFQRLNINDIEAVLKLQGKLIFTIEPKALVTELSKRFPELSNISVQIGLPAQVIIQASERNPILAWKQKDQLWWIDAQGFAFVARGDAAPTVIVESADAPPPYPAPTTKPSDGAMSIATTPTAPMKNLFAGARVELKTIAAALTLSPYLPEKSQLAYSTGHGLGWKDPRGWVVYFGSTLDDLDMKLAMYQAIVTQLTEKKIKPSLISIENLNAPYYRLER